MSEKGPKSQLFEAAYLTARRSQETHLVHPLTESSDYSRLEARTQHNDFRTELLVGVVGSFAVKGKLTPATLVMNNVAQYGDQKVMEARFGTHLDRALQKVNTFTGKRKEFMRQVFASAGLDTIWKERGDERPELMAANLTFFKPNLGFRSDFLYLKDFDQARDFVRAKAAEDSLTPYRAQRENAVYDMAAIEADETRTILARAAASCCMPASRCAGVALTPQTGPVSSN